jgi:hypothetical protein
VFVLIGRAPRLARVDREGDWIVEVGDVERGCGGPGVGEAVCAVCVVAGSRSAEDGGETFCGWDGDYGVVEGRADAAAAVGSEDRAVADVVGWARQNGAECADLAGV